MFAEGSCHITVLQLLPSFLLLCEPILEQQKLCLVQNEGLPTVPDSQRLSHPDSEVEVWFFDKMPGILHVTLWRTFSQAVKTCCWKCCGPEHLVKDIGLFRL